MDGVWNQARLGSVASLGVQQSALGVGNLTYGTSASDESISPSDGIHPTYNNYVQGPGATGMDPSSIETEVTSKGTLFPERPGQLNCDFYMRTGNCKYQLSCRFNHPKERASSLPNCIISPLGLPLRQVSSFTLLHIYTLSEFLFFSLFNMFLFSSRKERLYNCM